MAAGIKETRQPKLPGLSVCGGSKMSRPAGTTLASITKAIGVKGREMTKQSNSQLYHPAIRLWALYHGICPTRNSPWLTLNILCSIKHILYTGLNNRINVEGQPLN